MAVNITRNPVLQDVKHAGLYNNQFNETGIPYLKGSNPNHSQKFQDDAENFNYDDTTEDDTVSPATGKKLTVTNEHVTKDLEVGRDEKIHRDLEVEGNAHFVGRDVHSDPTDPTSDLIPNVKIEGTLEQRGKAHFLDEVDIEGKVNLNDETYINDDLHIAGTVIDFGGTNYDVTDSESEDMSWVEL